MPRLIRLYITQVAIGFTISLAFTVLVIVLDIGRLGYLMTHCRRGWSLRSVSYFFMLNGHSSSPRAVRHPRLHLRMAKRATTRRARPRTLSERVSRPFCRFEAAERVTGPHQP